MRRVVSRYRHVAELPLSRKAGEVLPDRGEFSVATEGARRTYGAVLPLPFVVRPAGVNNNHGLELNDERSIRASAELRVQGVFV